MFGRDVRVRRIQLGLSQEDLARLAGVDVKTIGNVEAGRTIPRPSTQRLLAEALRAAGEGRGGLYIVEPPRAQPRPGTADRPLSWELLYEIAEAFHRNGFPPPSDADLMHVGVAIDRILNRPLEREPCTACPPGQCPLDSSPVHGPAGTRATS